MNVSPSPDLSAWPLPLPIPVVLLPGNSGNVVAQFVFPLGEKMIVRLCPTEEETAELLSRVLGGNKLASEALARVVHQDVTFGDPALDAVEVDIPQDTLGIWVDPIGKPRGGAHFHVSSETHVLSCVPLVRGGLEK